MSTSFAPDYSASALVTKICTNSHKHSMYMKFIWVTTTMKWSQWLKIPLIIWGKRAALNHFIPFKIPASVTNTDIIIYALFRQGDVTTSLPWHCSSKMQKNAFFHLQHQQLLQNFVFRPPILKHLYLFWSWIS